MVGLVLRMWLSLFSFFLFFHFGFLISPPLSHPHLTYEQAYGLHRYSTMQYSKMEGQVDAWEENKHLPLPERMAAVFDWTPGLPYDPSGPHLDLTSFLPAHRAERLLCILREASYWFGKETAEKVELDPREKEGWVDAYDLQPDVPFPERVVP